MYTPTATANNQEYYKKLGQKYNLLPRAGLSQTGPQSPFNVLIAKDNFIQFDNKSVIRHPVLTAQSSQNDCYRKNIVGLKEIN